jgi:hypothetical protein
MRGIKRKKKGWKLALSTNGKLKRTHPGTDEPFPHGNQAGDGALVHHKGKDPLDVGIDLRILQLGLQGAIRAAMS